MDTYEPKKIFWIFSKKFNKKLSQKNLELAPTDAKIVISIWLIFNSKSQLEFDSKPTIVHYISTLKNDNFFRNWKILPKDSKSIS